MKKLLNCKVILALAICLTMFAGLAMTASAYPYLPSCPKCNRVMGYTGQVSKYCTSCGCTQTVEKFNCKYMECNGVLYYCPVHKAFFS